MSEKQKLQLQLIGVEEAQKVVLIQQQTADSDVVADRYNDRYNELEELRTSLIKKINSLN